MVVGFLVNNFPTLSQTFVLNQIAGLMDLGVDVRIFSRGKSKDDVFHPCVEQYNMLQKTCYFASENQWGLKRWLYNAFQFGKTLVCKPNKALFRSVNPLIFGLQAVRLQIFHLYRNSTKKGFEECSVVISHFGPNGIVAADLKALGVIKGSVAVVFHGYDVTKYVKQQGPQVYRRLFKWVEYCLPISYFWKSELTKIGCPTNKLEVHRMGIDAEKFEMRDHVNKELKDVICLSVARMVEKKGLEFAIRAVINIGKENPNKKIIYNLLGDGPLRYELEALASEAPENVKLIFKGAVNQEVVRQHLCTCDILLAPSVTASDGDMEGIPVVLMEAMAIGVPVISTEHSGISELIEDGKTGTLVPERNVDELVIAISNFIQNSADYKEMTTNARDFVVGRFNVKSLNAELYKMCDRLTVGNKQK